MILSRPLFALNVSVFLASLGYAITFPLIAIRLAGTEASGKLIGINAAMPALGWIVGEIVIPLLQVRQRVTVGRLAVAFLLIALVGLLGLALTHDYVGMSAARFVFGGAMGLYLRSVEYWINGISEPARRGRNLAAYNIVLMLAFVIGSALQPALGSEGWTSFAVVAVLIAAGGAVFLVWPRLPAPPLLADRPPLRRAVLAVMPTAFAAVLVYGLCECIPTTLIQVYALKNGLGEDVAAYALSAATLGNLLLTLPVATLSDRIGRTGPLLACALVATAASLLVPASIGSIPAFLALLVLWGGAAGSIYSLGLAMLGDRFHDAELVQANAVFGIVYAIGSLVGPLVNGAALDTLRSHGLLIASAILFSMLIVAVALGQIVGRLRRAA